MTTIVIVTREAHIAQATAEMVNATALEVQRELCRVLAACSVDDVLDILARESIDILIVDHYVVGTTGLELVRWLGQGLTNTTKILLTSDSRILADPSTFAGAAINAVLSRPLGRAMLRQTLTNWLTPAMRREPRSDGATGDWVKMPT